MTARKSLIITLRIIFVLFSLQFLYDAFYKWDGYSYYMQFIDFLPDASLVFMVWTIMVVIFAGVLWSLMYIFFKIIPRSIIPVRIEHFMFLLFFIALPLFMKRTFYSKFSISGSIGVSRLVILAAGLVLIVIIFLLVRKRTGKIIDSLLYGLNERITPLVWLFLILFLIAFPLSFLNTHPLQTENGSEISTERESNNPINPRKHPNIIIVVMDALSSMDMDLYGYNRQTTPFISKWAKNAFVFKNTYSSSSWTTPAMMSLMTGQRVWTHGVWNDVFYRPVNHHAPSLPEVLKGNGYETYSFVQNRYAHPSTLGLQDVFTKKDKYYKYWIPDTFYLDRITDLLLDRPIARVWISRSFIAGALKEFKPAFYETKAPPEMVFNDFIDFMSRRQNIQRPFFAWLHTWAPHFLYLPPKPFAGYFGDSEEFNSDRNQWSNFNFNMEYKEDQQRNVDILRKRYDEFILYCDKQFEIFMKNLSSVVNLDNTIIIFTADHGESFSHGFLGHAGPHLYAPLINIPLIIKATRENGGENIINDSVEQIDIAPTILDLAGIPVPEWMEGRSLLPLIEGKTLVPRPDYSMQFRTNPSFGQPITKGTVSVKEGSYKLVYYLDNKKTLLFNLAHDPDETVDLYEKEPEMGRKLSGLINENLAQANRRITATGRKQ